MGAIVFLMGLLPCAAQAQVNVRVTWTPSSSPDVTGYRVYSGTESGRYTRGMDVGAATQGTVSGLLGSTTYYFVVTAYNALGVESYPSVEVVYTTPGAGLVPTITLTSPLDGSVFQLLDTITLAATVQANGHSIAKVQFFNGPILVGEDTTAPYTSAWNSLLAGVFPISARVVYDGTLTASSDVATVTVGSAAPTIALTSPIQGATYSAPASVSIAADVQANGHSISKVRFLSGSTVLGEDATAPYAFTWNNVPAGSYTVSARLVYDGSQTLGSGAVTVTVSSAPQSPPTIVLTAPGNGTTYSAPASISMAANVQANGHSIARVQFLNGSTVVGEDVTWPYAFTWNNVPAGTYPLNARVIYDGALTAGSGVSTVTVGGAPPSVALTSPPTGASYMSPASVSLSAGVQANGHSIGKVQFLNGTTVVGEDLSAPYAFTWNNVPEGTYALSARAVYDGTLTAGSSVSTVIVTNGIPTIELNAPPNGWTYSAPASISLSATVQANGRAVAKVEFLNGATVVGEDAIAPYAFTWNNVPAGTYGLSARLVYDGTRTMSSSVSTVTVAGSPPSIALAAPPTGTSYFAPASISMSANVQANGHSIAKVQFLNSTTVVGEDVSAPYAFTWNNVPAGTYQLSARLVYGGTLTMTSAASTITVTNGVPAIALTSPSTGTTYGAPASVSLSASVQANGRSIARVQFLNASTVVGEDATAPYAFTWNNVPAGSYGLSARAIYDGSLTVASTVSSIRVTNEAPVIVQTSPANGSVYTAPASVSLSASVQANGQSIAKVQFLNGSTLLGEDSTAPYSFTWNNAPSGRHSLGSRVVYGAGATASSSPVVINVAAPTALPPPWQTLNLGTLPQSVGAVGITNDLFTISSGGNLSGTADNFRFVYQTLTDSAGIRFKVNSPGELAPAGSVGAMIRESLTPGSKHVFLGAGNDGTVRCLTRTGTSLATTTTEYPNLSLGGANWGFLLRVGGVVSVYHSSDGVSWAPIRTVDVAMSSTVYVGFAVASGTANNTATAQMSLREILP